MAGKADDQEFRQAVAELAAGMTAQRQSRPGLTFEEEPAPRRLAPFAYAVAATVAGPVAANLGTGGLGAGGLGAWGPAAGSEAARGLAGSTAATGGAAAADAEIGWGRFVLLFDAAGQEGWDGKYRIISYVRAELEPEMAADPLINAVGWSWLTEALELHSTGYRKISGTVTTVMTQGFGGKQDEPTSTGFELRASWSPVLADRGSADLDGHLAAWSDTVCTAAGLPPVPGVAPLRPPRRRPRP